MKIDQNTFFSIYIEHLCIFMYHYVEGGKSE